MKLLIVEDEINIIQMILQEVDWASLGIDETLTAYQGEKGLEICRREKPDIILTDIEMPVMDGIAMLEALQEIEGYAPEIIILTCHADFSYARDAMRFGAADYLLKPFYPEELHTVLLKAVFHRQKIIRERNSEAEKDSLLLENYYQALRIFAHDLISGSAFRNLSDIESGMEHQGIRDFDPYAPTRLVFAAYNEETRSDPDLLPAERSFIFDNIVREVIYGISGRGGLNCSLHIRPFFVNAGFVREDSVSREELARRCTRLISETERYMRMNVICVISEPCTADRFPEARKKAEAALPQVTDNQKTPVFLDERMGTEKVVYRAIDSSFIFRCIDERKRNDLIIALKRYLDGYGSEISLVTLQGIRQQVAGIFFEYYSANQIDGSDVFAGNDGRTLYENAAYGIVQMIKFVNYLYDFAMERLSLEKNKDTQAERVRQYIRDHYREDIDRESIAAHIRLAPNYLSHLFHKEFGKSIREYINECRVMEAKRLLGNTNQTVTEIALSIGFNNIPYFSTVFKKFTNMTPAEYRSAVAKGEES